MPSLAVRVNASSATARVRRARKVAGAPMAQGRGKAMVSALRRRTGDGMRAKIYQQKSGGSRRWKKRKGKPFNPSTPALRALNNAWRGGAGGGQVIEAKRAAIYVTQRWAHVHTGGKGLHREQRSETRIKTTLRQRRFFLAVFGIPLKVPGVIVVPARPHAAATPELHRDCALIVWGDF